MPPLTDLAAAIAQAAISLALGARLRTLARADVDRRLRLPFDFALGCWAIGTVALLLGLTVGFNRWILGGVVVVAGTVGRWRSDEWQWRLTIPSGAACLLLLPLALGRPFFYDSLVYHLGLPWQALLDGHIRGHPENIFSAFPPLYQMLSAPTLAFGLDSSPALLHLISFIAASTAVLAAAEILGAPRWAAAAASACIPFLPNHVLVASLPMAEGWLLLGVVISLGLTLSVSTPAVLTGLMVGSAIAARLQGITWAVILGLVFLALRRPGVALGLRWLAGVAAGALPWWLKNAILLLDPFAPIGWNREGVQALYRDAASHVSPSSSWLDAPAAFFRDLVPHTAYAGPMLLCAALVLIRLRRRESTLLGLTALAGLVAWELTGALPRFLSPTIAVLLVLAATCASIGLIGRLVSFLSLSTCLVLGLAASLSKEVPLVSAWIRDGFARRWGDVATLNDPRPCFELAVALPPEAKVLFVGEPRGYGFPRRFITPSQVDISPLREPLEGTASLNELCRELRLHGYTHLLVNHGELARLAPAYPLEPWRTAAGHRRFGELLGFLGPPVCAISAVEIYAVRPGS